MRFNLIKLSLCFIGTNLPDIVAIKLWEKLKSRTATIWLDLHSGPSSLMYQIKELISHYQRLPLDLTPRSCEVQPTLMVHGEVICVFFFFGWEKWFCIITPAVFFTVKFSPPRGIPTLMVPLEQANPPREGKSSAAKRAIR